MWSRLRSARRGARGTAARRLCARTKRSAPRTEAGRPRSRTRRLGVDEDVLRRPDARPVDERSHRNVHVGAVPHDREEERSTRATARVVREHDEEPEIVVTIDETIPGTAL